MSIQLVKTVFVDIFVSSLDETVEDTLVHIDNFDNKEQLLTAVYLEDDDPSGTFSGKNLRKETYETISPFTKEQEVLKQYFLDEIQNNYNHTQSPIPTIFDGELDHYRFETNCRLYHTRV